MEAGKETSRSWQELNVYMGLTEEMQEARGIPKGRNMVMGEGKELKRRTAYWSVTTRGRARAGVREGLGRQAEDAFSELMPQGKPNGDAKGACGWTRPSLRGLGDKERMWEPAAHKSQTRSETAGQLGWQGLRPRFTPFWQRRPGRRTPKRVRVEKYSEDREAQSGQSSETSPRAGPESGGEGPFVGWPGNSGVCVCSAL